VPYAGICSKVDANHVRRDFACLALNILWRSRPSESTGDTEAAASKELVVKRENWSAWGDSLGVVDVF
jgi:hypothetical protein